MEGEETEYTSEDLKLIAHVLNILSLSTDKTVGIALNNFHVSRFYNSTHHIAKNTRHYHVYPKYDGWEPEGEKYGVSFKHTLTAGKHRIKKDN